jgi:predicted metal-dependent peptidase
MLGHHLRRGDRNPKQWNIACDHVVNLILQGQGFTAIKDTFCDYQFKGMAVEQVFAILFPPSQENEDQDQDSTEDGQNGDSSPSEDQQASEGQEGQEDDSEDEGGGSDDSGDASDDQGDTGSSPSGSEDEGTADSESGDSGKGSGEPGTAREDEGPGSGQDQVPGNESSEGSVPGSEDASEAVEPGNPGDAGEVRDYPGDDDADFDAEAEKWDIAVQQAAQMERRLSPEGNLPGFVETILDNISDPKLPWQEILSRWLSSKAKNDYSWTRPNPRYSATGFILPALESFELGKVSIFWDTSCSVTDDQVADIGSETQGILAHFPGVLIDLYHIDTKVQYIEELDLNTDWDQITARGRGGTDFRPGFDAIEDSEEEYPVGVIYMTDGECSKFPEPPSYPVLWIVVDMPQDFRFDPPFGEVAYYNDF